MRSATSSGRFTRSLGANGGGASGRNTFSVSLVYTGPGTTSLTSMPWGQTSWASTCVNIQVPALEAVGGISRSHAVPHARADVDDLPRARADHVRQSGVRAVVHAEQVRHNRGRPALGI